MSRKPLAVISSEMTAAPPPAASTSTDAALLAALNEASGMMDELRSRAHASYVAARARSAAAPVDRTDWVELDARWMGLQRVVVAAQRAQEIVNVNSPPHQAARIAEARALLEAVGWFDGYQPPKAPKPSARSGLLALHYSAGGGEHWLETRERLEREREQGMGDAA